MTLIRSPFGTLLPTTVGFDRVFDAFENLVVDKPSFPHHNIIKQDDNNYIVELAVAGFTQDEIDIEVNENKLHIKGSKVDTETAIYLHRGIATRSFHKSITLANTVEVKGADLEHGILKVYLENIVPQEKKGKKIPIGNVAKKQQLLVE